MPMSTGCLAPLASMAIPVSQYSYFILITFCINSKSALKIVVVVVVVVVVVAL